MKIPLLVFSLFQVATAAGADATIGPPGCLIINPHPIPKETIRWSGACKDGYADGEGNLEWFINGAFSSFYKGTLDHGRKQGAGYWKNAAGDEYEGGFADGLREGKGVLLGASGDRYDGQWHAGAPDGTGTIEFALGGRYAGQWRRGLFHGMGKAVYAGGQIVEGLFNDGVAPGVKPRGMPAQVATYALKKDYEVTSFIKPEVVTGSRVPFEKSYAALSHDEQLAVKADYAMLFEGDEPPYPLHGTKGMDIWFAKALETLQVTGLLRMDVLVDAEGNAESVTVHRSPHPDMSKLAAQIAMAEKYKPAVCSGKPCAMAFPYTLHFVLE